MANSEGGSISSGEDSDLESRLQEDLELPEKKKKPGIIYLSSVPEGMNVSATTSFFAEFGRVGRVFLQPDTKMGMRRFTEGWIEFLSKKVAKRVAEQVNNTPVGGKRKHKSHYVLWNIKYLPRFKWVHLNERLAYEKAVKNQRLRTEISQVKREADQFKTSISHQLSKKKRKREESPAEEVSTESRDGKEDKLFIFQQEETFAARKRKLEEEKEVKEKEGSRQKVKKSKKDKKTKEKEEKSPPPVKMKKKKEAKKKKKSGKKSEPDVDPKEGRRKKKSASDEQPQNRGRSADEPSGKKSEHRKQRGEGVARRRSGEGADRAAFLKSVFGGGT